MALQSLIFSPSGIVQLNSLKRFALSGIIVPQQNLTVSKIPQAQSITQPGRATPIPLQGPADASTEIYSFTGAQGVVNQGLGTISTDGITVGVVGVGSKFLTQLQVGDTISTALASGTVASIQSDTQLQTVVAMAPGDTNANYFFKTTAARIHGENIFVSIQDQAWRRRLMNRDVPVIHVFGTNKKPLFLKESLLLESDQTLEFNFLNYSTTSAASFAPIAEGRKWQIEALKRQNVSDFIGGLRNRKQFIQPYWLTLDKGWSTLPIGGSSNEFMTCTGDITLFLFNCYGRAIRDSDGVDCSNLVTCFMKDAKTQRSMQTQPLPISCCAGIAINPMRFPTPWIVEPQTQIQLQFVNNSGVACKVYMTMHGVAIYTGSSWHGSTLTNKQLMREGARMYEAMSTPQIRPAEPQG